MTADSAEAFALGQDEIAALRKQLRGPLLLPGEPAYDEARSVWNAMIPRRPPRVARCLDVGDVVTAVNFARDHNIPLSVKGGGHTIAGLAVGPGLLLDFSLMREVKLDPAA